MKNLRKMAMATAAVCALSVLTVAPGTAKAAETENETVIYEAPMADGIDLGQNDLMVATTSRKYNSPEFTVGVYMNGAPFTMDKNGTAIFTNANQMALDTSIKADVSYQILGNYTNKVISGTRKIGNVTGKTINVSSKVQANEEVKVYLKNNAGTATSASGTFKW